LLSASRKEWRITNLAEQDRALYRTDDFLEGRKAEAEGRPPVYHGR
jgi:hypothetical protein